MRAVAVLTCLIAAGAAAAPRELAPAAKQHSDAGVAAYGAGDYETASREFEAAYASDPEPSLLYAWAQARRLGGHCAEAVALYERYVAAGVTSDQEDAARTGISLCPVTAPPSAPAPVSAEPSPPPSPRLDDVGPSPSPWYRDRLGGALAVGGVVGAGVGVTLLVLAARSEDAANEAAQRGDFLDAFERARQQQLAGYVTLGIGVALGVAAAARYATSGASRARVALTTTGTTLVVAGTF